MGLCCAAPATADNSSIPGTRFLTIHGDFFSPETRTITSALKISGVKFELVNVDQFKGEHKKEPYLDMNPTGSLPTI